MTKPATDERIAAYEECPWGLHGDSVLSLIARIRAEQASQATAREQAIRECADRVLNGGPMTSDMGSSEINSYLEYVSKDLLNLLQTGEETK